MGETSLGTTTDGEEKNSNIFVEITEDKLSVESASEFVTFPCCGGISIFVGTTRDNFEGKKVLSLEYECYRPMAIKEIYRICTQVKEKWPTVARIYVIHRVGLVPVSESSIIVATSSPHRKEAIEATEYCVDVLKATVPIWKKELFEDGTKEWKSNKECCWSTTDSTHK